MCLISNMNDGEQWGIMGNNWDWRLGIGINIFIINRLMGLGAACKVAAVDMRLVENFNFP